MAYVDEIIIASGVTSDGLVAGPEAEGGSASVITIESGGKLANGIVKAGGAINATYGANLTDVTAETGAVIDLAYGATGKPATSGMTLRGADTAIAEGTLRYSGTLVNGHAANGVLYDVSGAAEWRFCIGDGLTVSGATLTTGARIYTEEGGIIQTANILQSGNIGLGGSAVSYDVTAGATGVARGKATFQIAENAKAYRTLVSQGGQANVRAYAEDMTVFSDGKVTVSNGGVASTLKVSSGGEVYVYGGLVSGAEFAKGGKLYMYGGLVSSAAIGSGATADISAGVLSGGYVSSGATVRVVSGGTISGAQILGPTPFAATVQVSNGGIADDVVVSGARMYVYSGGVANRGVVAVAGVGINVMANGRANNTSLTAANAFLNVNSDGVSYYTVGLGGVENVSKGGLSISATFTAGTLNVREAVASGTVMNGGVLGVSAGARAVNAAINKGGSAVVSSGGLLLGGHVSSGGVVIVRSRGVVSGIKVLNGTNYVATLQVSGGGIASNIIISGTRVIVSSGGTALGTVVNRNGVGINVSKGGSAKNTVLKSGWQLLYSAVGENTVVKGGSETVYAGGKSISATVYTGALNVSNGGVASGAVVNGGDMRVSSGGVASGAVINKNATLTVVSAGTANVVFNPWMGTVVSNTGATVNYLGRDRDIYLAEAQGLVSRADAFENLNVLSDGSAIAWGGTIGKAKVYAGGSMIMSGAALLSDLTVAGGATFSSGCGAAVDNVEVLSGGYVWFAPQGVRRVNNLDIRSGATVTLNSGANLSIGDVTIFAGGSLALNNMVAAARISGALVLDLSGAKGNNRYMVYSSFHYVTNGSRIVRASEEIGNYVYKLVQLGGDNSSAYNFTLDVSGNEYKLARGGSVINPLAKMTYTAGSAVSGTGYDVRLTTVVDGAYTITPVDTAAALATNGQAVNTNDKMARWTADTDATASVNLASGMTTGNAWLEIDGATVGAALYGAAEDQTFAGAVNVKLTNGSIRNLAGGAAAGGTVKAVNFTMAGGELAGNAYAGGFGNVTGETTTMITTGSLAKDFYAGALANKLTSATSVGDVSMTIGGGTFSGNIYGASAVKTDAANGNGTRHTAGDVTLTVTGGSTTKGTQACIFAGGYATGNATGTVYTVGSVSAAISGGSWGTAAGGRGVFGGVMASGVKAQVIGEVNLTISGDAVMGNVYGGGWAQKSGGRSIVGDVNISIADGTITNVFGGGSHSTSGGTTETGDITITVSGGDITNAIYARGQLDGDTTGAAEVIFTGAANFGCGVYGYSCVGGTASDAALSFSGYTGEFAGAIGGFNGITLDGATAMTLTTAAEDVSNGGWAFDVSERETTLAGTAMLRWEAADFAGDRIELNLAADSTSAWTLVDGAATAAYGEFDVLVDGNSILGDTLALGEKIIGGVYDGWGFTLDGSALKFKQLA